MPRLNAALEGRYRIERQLGEGGMATVYLADDLKHERKVALKVLKPEPRASWRFRVTNSGFAGDRLCNSVQQFVGIDRLDERRASTYGLGHVHWSEPVPETAMIAGRGDRSLSNVMSSRPWTLGI